VTVAIKALKYMSMVLDMEHQSGLHKCLYQTVLNVAGGSVCLIYVTGLVWSVSVCPQPHTEKL
jgi:hypothetical protein